MIHFVRKQHSGYHTILFGNVLKFLRKDIVCSICFLNVAQKIILKLERKEILQIRIRHQSLVDLKYLSISTTARALISVTLFFLLLNRNSISYIVNTSEDEGIWERYYLSL